MPPLKPLPIRGYADRGPDGTKTPGAIGDDTRFHQYQGRLMQIPKVGQMQALQQALPANGSQYAN